ncbi:unnamed protein product, partial [Phaeothamnion confervicola]
KRNDISGTAIGRSWPAASAQPKGSSKRRVTAPHFWGASYEEDGAPGACRSCSIPLDRICIRRGFAALEEAFDAGVGSCRLPCRRSERLSLLRTHEPPRSFQLLPTP